MRVGGIRAAALAAAIAIAAIAGMYHFVFNSDDRRPPTAATEVPKPPANPETPTKTDTRGPIESVVGSVQSRIPTWLIIALLGMAAATCCAVLVSFYLYRWRRILLAHPHATVPEEWAKFLQQVGAHVQVLDADFRKGFGQVWRATTEHSERIAALEDSLGILQHALSERDAEINRLKSGYDAAVFRRFLNRFIRIDQSLKEVSTSDATTLDELFQIRKMFDDALDQCGVEAFAPDVGTDYRVAKGVADNPRKEKTSNHADDFKIAEVLEPGYRLKGEDCEVLVPAKVKILVFGA